MKTTRQTLMTALVKAQNHPANSGQDIVTFSAFLDDAELASHIARYEQYALDHDRKRAA